LRLRVEFRVIKKSFGNIHFCNLSFYEDTKLSKFLQNPSRNRKNKLTLQKFSVRWMKMR
jgi:hypothetical protein